MRDGNILLYIYIYTHHLATKRNTLFFPINACHNNRYWFFNFLLISFFLQRVVKHEQSLSFFDKEKYLYMTRVCPKYIKISIYIALIMLSKKFEYAKIKPLLRNNNSTFVARNSSTRSWRSWTLQYRRRHTVCEHIVFS